MSTQKIGPGLWYLLHSRAASAKDHMDIGDINDLLEDFTELLGASCARHISEYTAAHPLAIDCSSQQTFEWMWKFHNDVNIHLKKPTMSLEEATAIYLSPGTRSSVCSNGNATEHPQDVNSNEKQHEHTGNKYISSKSPLAKHVKIVSRR